ncbi:glycosyltransferase [Microvirga tunisiensis]|uniref:Glycosyltransferase family 4 protein n=1 Tax=Microvirga tunisiensis TaxID=2108360 RepID=A0A5N7MS60_9HYPH|nr:glycosyltransferase [Microvirga tunisiensis]MPR11895.1 glycosyltransferase family 4 protein [Microvirga tunisiensis]MPR29827.1 glycosyltransferase family 4 protein [Microvirga tunisiensis]
MKIGIFLAYRPNTEFTNQGLGRLLAELTDGFFKHAGEPVTIICPSWLRRDITRLLSQLPEGSVRIVSPRKLPVIVRMYDAAAKRAKGRAGHGRLRRMYNYLRRRIVSVGQNIYSGIVSVFSTDNLLLFVVAAVALALLGTILAIALSPVIVSLVVLILLFAILRRLHLRSKVGGVARLVRTKTSSVIRRLLGRERNPIQWSIFNNVKRKEIDRMLGMIETMRDIDVWYSPTVFWPEFNEIKGIGVQCFPDMLLSEFPTSFALDSPRNSEMVYDQVTSAIAGGKYFITYSDVTAGPSLSAKFGVPRGNIFTIPHAAMRLDKHIVIDGAANNDDATDAFASSLIAEVRNLKWSASDYLRNFDFSDTSYLFYASQFRPNKNIMNLVIGWEKALRERHQYCKLVLTGDIAYAPDVRSYINERRLQYDVIFAHDVSERVLAALYRRAVLAVNPTLYEGGFPFTFTEGMSVGTPSIMSRIPQTEQMIKGDLARMMLFDPLSPDDIADKIVFGLTNRRALLDAQRPLYEEMRKRMWADVARDHVVAFNEIIRREASSKSAA